MKKLLIITLYTLLLPVFLLKDVIKSQRSIVKKIFWIIIVLIFFGFLYSGQFNKVKSTLQRNLFYGGITDKIVKIPVKGTSMLPTVKDGEEISLHNVNKFGLARGDIIGFKNEQTGGLSYLKRVIGLPGETIIIKNGHVLINGKVLIEDYIYNRLPTFGNTYLTECEINTIPKNQYAVLGDNRTVSSDSRYLGFVHKDEIEGVIKTNTTDKYADKLEQTQIFEIDISAVEFLSQINNIRGEHKLVTHKVLNQLAQDRANQITNNFSDWKNKTIPISNLLDESGYRYNRVYEFVTFGYLTEEQILEQILDSPIEKDEFLTENFTEVGIGIAEITRDDCKFPVISVVLSWPSIPTYDPEVIDRWSKEIEITNKVLSDMQSWVGNETKDPAEIRKIIDITAEANTIARRIHSKMTDKEWLTSKDYADIEKFNKLALEGNELQKKFFGVEGATTNPELVRRL